MVATLPKRDASSGYIIKEQHLESRKVMLHKHTCVHTRMHMHTLCHIHSITHISYIHAYYAGHTVVTDPVLVSHHKGYSMKCLVRRVIGVSGI